MTAMFHFLAYLYFLLKLVVINRRMASFMINGRVQQVEMMGTVREKI